MQVTLMIIIIIIYLTTTTLCMSVLCYRGEQNYKTSDEGRAAEMKRSLADAGSGDYDRRMSNGYSVDDRYSDDFRWAQS